MANTPAAQWQVLEIPSDSVLYPPMLELRKVELRKPLGLDLLAADLAAEVDQRHFVLTDREQQVVGCALLVVKSPVLAKVRQVAIAEIKRGKGLGKILMSGVENAAQVSGIAEITLHARETAVAFYEKIGYKIEGEPFIEIGLPHFLMRKRLS